MASRLLKTSFAYENIKNFIDGADGDSDYISALLAQHLLIILSADVQQELYKIAELRASLVTDTRIKDFVSSATKRLVRSVSKDDLAKYLDNFGKDAKSIFNGKLDDRVVTTYSNALGRRHDVAHKGACTATLNEMADIIKSAEAVLEALHNSLMPEG